MTQSRVLHLLPRCTGAGPERSLLASIAYAPSTATMLHHTIAVLDVPVAASMFLAARRLGVEFIVQPDLEALERAAVEADVIVIHYWNHPLLLDLLSRADLGATRVVVWSMVLGLHPPQVLTAEVGQFADVLVMTTERSLMSEAARHCSIVRTIPGIADMSRLDNWKPLPHEGIHVGYLGTVSPAKMHPRFAELCSLVADPSVRFVVAGAGGGENQLCARMLELGLKARFVFDGYVGDISNELGTFDIFGYPLCADTYATSEKSLQEAMWVGIPPVVFPYGGLVDLVEHEVTGLVVESDNDYGEAIDRLAGDSKLRQRLGSEAQRVARQKFDPNVLAAAWSEVIDLALAQPRRVRELLYENCSGAELFIAANGDEAGPFALSYLEPTKRVAADEEVRTSSPLVVGGDGGIAHYQATWPEDPVLAKWSNLVWQPREID